MSDESEKKQFEEQVEQKVIELLSTWRGHNAPDVPEGAEPEKVEIARKTTLKGELGKGGLGFDSLDCVEVLMTLEDYFEVMVCDEAADKIETVGDLIDALAGTPYKANGKNPY